MRISSRPACCPLTAASCTRTLIGNPNMADTLGIDLSDLIPRLAVVDAGGQVTSRAEAPAGDANAIREATRRALAGARGPVAAVGVALPSPFDKLPSEIAAALRDATSREIDIVAVAAGTA